VGTVEFEGMGVRADCATAGDTSNTATLIAANTTFLMFDLLSGYRRIVL